MAEVSAASRGDAVPGLNGAFDDLVPKGMQHYWKADFVTELTDEAIAAHITHEADPHVSRRCISIRSTWRAARRLGEQTPSDTGTRTRLEIVGIWSDSADNEANIQWVKDYYAAIHPHSGSAMAATSTSCRATTTGACELWRQLRAARAVKAAYDPDNLFHVNQNIVSAGGAERHRRDPETTGTRSRPPCGGPSLIDAARDIAPIIRQHCEEV